MKRYSARRNILILMTFLLTAGFSGAQPGERDKKLIKYGWDVPEPEFVRQNIRQMERLPFDGAVIRLGGQTINVFSHRAYDPARFTGDIANLKATVFSKFAHNFILMMSVNEKGWDWFSESDWKATEKNVRLFAQVARAGGCGICFDPEPYAENPWLYSAQPHAGEKSFDDYRRQIRKRGAQFVRAIQPELPEAKILTFFQVSILEPVLGTPDSEVSAESLGKDTYGLLPAFLNGMLDAARPGTLIIDGNELAFYYTGSESFFRGYHTIRQGVLKLIAPTNRRKYRLQVQAGHAVYMDELFGLRRPEKGFISYYMTPEERARWFEHNVYYALYTSDEYAWCFSEQMNWWENRVPAGAETALRSAREKIRQGKPLGFSIEETVRAATKRKLQQAESELIRRTATIMKLRREDSPPSIDGKTDDAIWDAVKPLEPFIPILRGGAKKTEAQTLVRVVYDDRHLYAAIRCQEPEMEKLVIAGSKRDDPLWEGDTVELLISQGRTADPFFHFILNPKSLQYDRIVAGGVGDPQFSPDWKAAASMDRDAWTVEVAIPWSAIGGTPEVGERRKANIGRARKPIPELSTWSQVLETFAQPGQFGEWIFGL